MSLCSLGDVTISSAFPSGFSNQSRQAVEEGAELFGRVSAAWLKLIGRISLGLKLEESWGIRFYFRGKILISGEESLVGEILFGHPKPDGSFDSVRCHKVIFDPKEFGVTGCYVKLHDIQAKNLWAVRKILTELGAGSLEIV